MKITDFLASSDTLDFKSGFSYARDASNSALPNFADPGIDVEVYSNLLSDEYLEYSFEIPDIPLPTDHPF